MGKIDSGLRLAQIALQALAEISRLTKSVKDDRAADVLRAIHKFASTFQRGVEGKVTPTMVDEAFTLLKTSIAGNDARVDAALKKRFGKG
jgi:hypothetical protein